MVSSRPLISNFSNPLIKYLGIVPGAPITIVLKLTLMFHSFFFSSLPRSNYLSLFLFSLVFSLCSAGTAKSTIRQILCFSCQQLLRVCVCVCVCVADWPLTEPCRSSYVNRKTATRGCKQLRQVDSRKRVAWVDNRKCKALWNHICRRPQ